MLRLLGWQCEGEVEDIPNTPKCVIVAAPHNTGWDLPYTLLASFQLGLPAVFMMKDSLFAWPLGILWRFLGGVPINRRKSTSTVQQMVTAFSESEVLRVIIAPEGTRSRVKHWKLGFYWMAHGADVPIVLAYIDYRRKVVGIGAPWKPSGDVEMDFKHIQAFYEEKTGMTPVYDAKRLQ